MTTFQKGDILLVEFPFVSGGQSKRRPSLVVIDTGDADVVVARITTRTKQLQLDVPISDWAGAGLNSPSIVRLGKLAAIGKSVIVLKLGSLQPADRNRVATVLAVEFSNW
jgi:mRNA interferase MazF